MQSLHFVVGMQLVPFVFQFGIATYHFFVGLLRFNDVRLKGQFCFASFVLYFLSRYVMLLLAFLVVIHEKLIYASEQTCFICFRQPSRTYS